MHLHVSSHIALFPHAMSPCRRPRCMHVPLLLCLHNLLDQRLVLADHDGRVYAREQWLAAKLHREHLVVLALRPGHHQGVRAARRRRRRLARCPIAAVSLLLCCPRAPATPHNTHKQAAWTGPGRAVRCCMRCLTAHGSINSSTHPHPCGQPAGSATRSHLKILDNKFPSSSSPALSESARVHCTGCAACERQRCCLPARRATSPLPCCDILCMFQLATSVGCVAKTHHRLPEAVEPGSQPVVCSLWRVRVLSRALSCGCWRWMRVLQCVPPRGLRASRRFCFCARRPSPNAGAGGPVPWVSLPAQTPPCHKAANGGRAPAAGKRPEGVGGATRAVDAPVWVHACACACGCACASVCGHASSSRGARPPLPVPCAGFARLHRAAKGAACCIRDTGTRLRQVHTACVIYTRSGRTSPNELQRTRTSSFWPNMRKHVSCI